MMVLFAIVKTKILYQKGSIALRTKTIPKVDPEAMLISV